MDVKIEIPATVIDKVKVVGFNINFSGNAHIYFEDGLSADLPYSELDKLLTATEKTAIGTIQKKIISGVSAVEEKTITVLAEVVEVKK